MLVAVALLTALAIGWRVSTAGELDTVTTTLQPGLNYVGWLGPDTPVEEILAELPPGTAIFGWYRSEQRWLMAARTALPGVETFNVSAGGGLAIRLGGDQPVDWERPHSLASGFIPLRAGWNLIAWTAERDVGLDELTRDLRTSFTPFYNPRLDNVPAELSVHQPERTDRRGKIEQGRAIWARASKGGYWLQRSDAIVSIRGQLTSDDGQSRSGTIINATADEGDWFYGSIRSDGSFTIPVRADRSYRLWLYQSDADDCSLGYRDGLATRDSDGQTILKPTNDLTLPRFHIQDGACGWAMSGTITRYDGSPLSDAHVTASRVGRGTGTPGRTSSDGYFEIIPRSDHPIVLEINPERNCRIFYREGGYSLSEDDATRIDLSNGHVRGLDLVVPRGVCEWRVHGRAVTEDGKPVVSWDVRAYDLQGRRFGNHTPTAVDGGFHITVPIGGTYKVVLQPNSACSFVSKDGELSHPWPTDTEVKVIDGDVFGIELVTPSMRCNWQIGGRLIDAYGDPLEGLTVRAGWNHEEHAWRFYYATSGTNGEFVVQTAAAASYELAVFTSEECIGWFDGDVLSEEEDQAIGVEIGENGISDLLIRVPEGVCHRVD